MAKVLILKHFTFIAILFIILVSCDPNRHQMPITTSSEEARELYKEARYWDENFDPITADSLVHQAFELDPDFALAHLLLYPNAGVSKAMVLIDQVSDGEAYMIRAYKALLERDYFLAESLVDTLLMLHPKDKHCLYFACVVARKEEKGIVYLNRAVKLDRYYAAPHLRGGICEMALNNYEAAEKHYQRYISLTPESGFGMDSYANWLQNQGREDEALKHWLMAIQVDPTYFDPYRAVIGLYFRRGEIEQILKFVEPMYKVSKIPRFKAIALQWKANAMLIQGNLQHSLDIMDQIIHLDWGDDQIRREIYTRHYKGWFAMRGNRPDLALAIFKDNLEMALQPEIADWDKTRWMMRTYGCLSILHGELKDNLKANEYLSLARELFVTRNYYTDKIYMKLYEGVFAFYSGNYEYVDSVLNEPDYHQHNAYQYYLAEMLRLKGNHEQALKRYRMATSKDNYAVNQYWAALFYNESVKWLEVLGNE